MAAIGTAGNLAFIVSPDKTLTYSDIEDACSVRAANHEPVRGEVITEFLGPGQAEKKLTIWFARELGVDPAASYAQLRSMQDKGEHFPIILGGRPAAQHDWYIDDINGKTEHFEPGSGAAAITEVSVTFKAYR